MQKDNFKIIIQYLFKSPCSRGESLGIVYMCIEPFNNIYLFSILVWIGRTVAYGPSYPYCYIAWI